MAQTVSLVNCNIDGYIEYSKDMNSNCLNEIQLKSSAFFKNIIKYTGIL